MADLVEYGHKYHYIMLMGEMGGFVETTPFCCTYVYQCMSTPVPCERAFCIYTILMSEITNTDRDTVEQRIHTLAESVFHDSSLFVVEVETRGRYRVNSVIVYVEGDDGVTIDQCAEISRSLDALLKIEGVVDEDTRLDVSSPGLSRPLLLPRQYTRHIGRELSITLNSDEGEMEKIEGKLASADEKSIVVETESGPCDVQYVSISTAKVKLPW